MRGPWEMRKRLIPSRLPVARRASFLASIGALGLVLASCATFSEPFAVSVKNDLPTTVTLSVCDSPNCSKVVEPWLLRPGEVGSVNVEVDGGYNPAILVARGGVVVGCMPFRLNQRPTAELTVLASQAVRCGSSAGVSRTHGKDWPDP